MIWNHEMVSVCLWPSSFLQGLKVLVVDSFFSPWLDLILGLSWIYCKWNHFPHSYLLACSLFVCRKGTWLCILTLCLIMKNLFIRMKCLLVESLGLVLKCRITPSANGRDFTSSVLFSFLLFLSLIVLMKHSSRMLTKKVKGGCHFPVPDPSHLLSSLCNDWHPVHF